MVFCPLQITAGAGPLRLTGGTCLAVPDDPSGSSMYTMVQHSKLQKQVLSLYRQFLRASKGKPGFFPRIQAEFRRNASIPRTDVMYIEYLYRRGQRQLEQLRDVNTKQMSTFVKTKPEER
uniref:Complex 1 LYR protein domain-containing protein n=1 Tax=Pelusios castaneus TaxID=367368 RepID=A0A8C8R7R5_9SAUR